MNCTYVEPKHYVKRFVMDGVLNSLKVFLELKNPRWLITRTVLRKNTAVRSAEWDAKKIKHGHLSEDAWPNVLLGYDLRTIAMDEKDVYEGVDWEGAMKVSTKEEADGWLDVAVRKLHAASQGSQTKIEIEFAIKSNLGWFAGYYSHEDRDRIEKLFGCQHPYFGSIAVNGPPSVTEAIRIGIQRGKELAAQAKARNSSVAEGKIKKGGINRTYQIKQRPAPPAPMTKK
jgi:hypothetical protein